MPFNVQTCMSCGQTVTIESRLDEKEWRTEYFSCGHSRTFKLSFSDKVNSLISTRKHQPYGFQKEGIHFIEASNFRCLLADEMGLGKSVMMVATLELHKDKMLPALIVCKSSLVHQWIRHVMEWVKPLPGTYMSAPHGSMIVQHVSRSGEIFVPQLFGVSVVSYDLLWRMDPEKFPVFKTVLLDETQQINNTSANRSVCVRKMCQSAEYVIGASGTPVKNRASEWFQILNILRPEQFPNKVGFEWHYIDAESSKIDTLADPEQFREDTKDFIIRRERADVLPDLPKTRRDYNYSELGQKVQKLYDKEVRVLLTIDTTTNKFERARKVNQSIMRMWHLTGLAKAGPAIEFINEFLEETDRKLAVFVHHHDVADELRIAFPDALHYRGANDQDVLTLFEMPEHRLGIFSTRSGGVGLDLQFCADCYFVERQWGPVDEEQAEGRFSRPGQKADKIVATYGVAIGTIDEHFARIVEEKRGMFDVAVRGKEAKPWDQAEVNQQLAAFAIQKMFAVKKGA